MNTLRAYHETERPDEMPCLRDMARRALDLTQESLETLRTTVASGMGRLALHGADIANDNHTLLMARGGNFKVVRANLINSGKANSRQPMPPEQKKLRKRKRRKK